VDDIKLTLSNNPNLRSQTIEEEARWMNQEGPLYYTLSRNKPLRAEAGCWVYFIKGGQLAGRARAERIGKASELHPEPLFSYSGKELEQPPDNYEVECKTMEVASHPIPHKGFQGFRYVLSEEVRAFENAFRKRGS
jgi:hypothetical protein